MTAPRPRSRVAFAIVADGLSVTVAAGQTVDLARPIGPRATLADCVRPEWILTAPAPAAAPAAARPEGNS